MLLVSPTSSFRLHLLPFTIFYFPLGSKAKAKPKQSIMMGRSFNGHKKKMGASSKSWPCPGISWGFRSDFNGPSNTPSTTLSIPQLHLGCKHRKSTPEYLLLPVPKPRKKLSHPDRVGTRLPQAWGIREPKNHSKHWMFERSESAYPGSEHPSFDSD